MTTLELIGSGGGIVLVILTLVQISPIKLNPWTFIARKIGKAINGELIEKVDEMSKELTEIKGDISEQKAVECRTNILRFGDEVLHKQRHTKEHFDQILADIDEYDKYCAAHPDFENHRTEETSKRILHVYEQCLIVGDFL